MTLTLAPGNAPVPGTITNSPAAGVKMDPAQVRLLNDESRVQVVCWHRQKGKDFTTARKAVRHALKTGQSWFIVSLTQRQADATFDKCKFWAKHYKAKLQEYDEEFTEYDPVFDHTFTFKSRELILPGGGRVISMPGRDPDRLAGFTGNVIFTEFGLFPNGGYDHWRVVFPLTTRGYSVIAISTPRGKETKFYELVSNPDLYSVHLCDIYQSIAEGLVLTDQDGKPTDVQTYKALYGDDVGWQREYECKFMGALDALIRWAQIEAAGAAGKGLPFDLLRCDNGGGWDAGFFRALSEIHGRPEIGWDVARRGHLSSLWVNDGRPDTKRLRYLVLMHNCSFALQREIVGAAMRAKVTAVGCGDATGLGMDSNETLTTKYPGRWEGVDFGGKRKSDLGSGLATAFKDNAQTLPDFAGGSGGDNAFKFIATDLYAIQRESGKDTASGEDGKARLKLVESENPLMPESHCDIAYSAALAIRAGHRPDIQGVMHFGPTPKQEDAA
jgi:phage FluMu gp28-like protein